MRLTRALCLALLFSELRHTSAQDAMPSYCPQTASLSGTPTDHWFEGTMGPKHVRMYMERGGQEVVGLYYDVADWKPVLLGGKWTDEGNVQVTTSLAEPSVVAIGTLQGRISSSGELTGTLTTSGGSDGRQQSVAMKRVPQPSCSGGGVWHRFSNPEIPITFSYPTSWHVEIVNDDMPGSEGDERVELTCPDPMSLAYGWNVGFSPEPIEEDGRVLDFIQFDGGPWVYGCDSDTRELCRKPVVTHRAGITTYRADEIEVRTYCVDGGYVGQGEGHRFLLSFDDNWMQFSGSGLLSDAMERIVSTIQIRK